MFPHLLHYTLVSSNNVIISYLNMAIRRLRSRTLPNNRYRAVRIGTSQLYVGHGLLLLRITPVLLPLHSSVRPNIGKSTDHDDSIANNFLGRLRRQTLSRSGPKSRGHSVNQSFISSNGCSWYIDYNILLHIHTISILTQCT